MRITQLVVSGAVLYLVPCLLVSAAGTADVQVLDVGANPIPVGQQSTVVVETTAVPTTQNLTFHEVGTGTALGTQRLSPTIALVTVPAAVAQEGLTITATTNGSTSMATGVEIRPSPTTIADALEAGSDRLRSAMFPLQGDAVRIVHSAFLSTIADPTTSRAAERTAREQLQEVHDAGEVVKAALLQEAVNLIMSVASATGADEETVEEAIEALEKASGDSKRLLEFTIIRGREEVRIVRLAAQSGCVPACPCEVILQDADFQAPEGGAFETDQTPPPGLGNAIENLNFTATATGVGVGEEAVATLVLTPSLGFFVSATFNWKPEDPAGASIAGSVDQAFVLLPPVQIKITETQSTPCDAGTRTFDFAVNENTMIVSILKDLVRRHVLDPPRGGTS